MVGWWCFQVIFYGTEDLNTNTDYTIANSEFKHNNATTHMTERAITRSLIPSSVKEVVEFVSFFSTTFSTIAALHWTNTLEGNSAVFSGALICVSGSISH